MGEVLIGLLAGVVFGLMTVLVRRGVVRHPDPLAGTVVITAGGTLAVAAIVVATGAGGYLMDVRAGLPFAAVGVLAPGLSQLLLTVAARDAGASRVGIMIGTSPLLASALAVTIGDEALVPGLVVGTVLIVAGGIAIAWQRELPQGFRRRGVAMAFAAALMFAFRDNLVHAAGISSDLDPRAATAWSLLGATVAVAAFTGVALRGELPGRVAAAARPFLLPALVLGLGYTVLVTALDLGRVTVFAPLNAMQSMWTVLLAWVLIGRGDGIGARVVAAAVLVVAGGVLIGVAS
jgi:drug/metabolite transporter (DMT)-like permease